MILPERVFGQGVDELDVIGLRDRRQVHRDVLAQLVLEVLARCVKPTRSTTYAWIMLPLTSCGRPIAAASATAGWLTNALSTSAVPRRWPETLMTSSVRPMIQK
jgi:hypothetical protein